MSEVTAVDSVLSCSSTMGVVESSEALLLYEWSSPPVFEPQKQLDLLIGRSLSQSEWNCLKC